MYICVYIVCWRRENPSHYQLVFFFTVFQTPCEYSLILYNAVTCERFLDFLRWSGNRLLNNSGRFGKWVDGIGLWNKDKRQDQKGQVFYFLFLFPWTIFHDNNWDELLSVFLLFPRCWRRWLLRLFKNMELQRITSALPYAASVFLRYQSST